MRKDKAQSQFAKSGGCDGIPVAQTALDEYIGTSPARFGKQSAAFREK